MPMDPLDLKVPWHTDVPPDGLGLVPYLEGLKLLKMGETQAKELRDAGKLPKVHSRGRRLFFLWHELQRYIADEVNKVRLAEWIRKLRAATMRLGFISEAVNLNGVMQQAFVKWEGPGDAPRLAYLAGTSRT